MHMDPQVPQHNLQLWDAGWLLLLHLIFHEVPGVFNRVEIRRTTRPVNGLYLLLVDGPEGQQMVFQDVHIIVPSHCYILW